MFNKYFLACLLLIAIGVFVRVGYAAVVDDWFEALDNTSFDNNRGQYMKNDVHLTSGNDTLRFSSGDDYVYMGPGDDALYFGGGSDIIYFHAQTGDVNRLMFYSDEVPPASFTESTEIIHYADTDDLEVRVSSGNFIIRLGNP